MRKSRPGFSAGRVQSQALHSGPRYSAHRRGQAADQHVWLRGWLTWHLVFGTLELSTAVLLIVESDPSLPLRLAGIAILIIAGGWYAIVGTKVLGAERSRTGQAFVAVEATLIIALFGLSPSGALMLCILYPHIWAALPSRRAALMTATAGAGTAVAILRWTGLSAMSVLTVYAVAAGAVLLALVTGSWIDQIIEQSKRRAALITELETARGEVAELSHANGVMAERTRLARDIHDTLAQGFASVILLLDATQAQVGRDDDAALGHLCLAQKTAQQNLAEARAMVEALTPPSLAHASLATALQELVDGVASEQSARDGSTPELRASLTVTGEPWPLSANAQVVLLRSAQEALTNVRKHAAASRVKLELSYHHDSVVLRVADDGKGLPVGGSATTGGSGAFGLAGMRARATGQGGLLRLDSVPGGGTTVTVELPRLAADSTDVSRR